MQGEPPATPRYRTPRPDGGRDRPTGERRGYRAVMGPEEAGVTPGAPGGYRATGEGGRQRTGTPRGEPAGEHEAGQPGRRQYGRPAGGRVGAPRGMETARYPEQFVDHLTPEMRMLLDDSIEASQVAAWCADRCIEHGPEAGDCVRLCNEVAQIADLNANFISKDAFNVLATTEAFVAVADQAVAELEKIPQVHAEEARAVLERAIDSAENVLEAS